MITGTCSVKVHAEFTGTRPDQTATIDIRGDNIPLDHKLLAALKAYPKYRTLAESFHPSGLANFSVISGWRQDSALPDGGCWENHYVIEFHDAAVKYDPFPIRLEKIHLRPIGSRAKAGFLHVAVREIEGRHGGTAASQYNRGHAMSTTVVERAGAA